MKNDFQCSAPWQGLFINPDGDFRVCCAGQSLGNLNNNTLIEILNGSKLKSIQREIITQGYSSYCKNCMDMEKIQGKSLRDQFEKDLNNVDTTKFQPSILDIRWRNTCHLRCSYCNSDWSSAFAQWEGKTLKVSEREWQQEVLDHIRENKVIFKHVNMLGGEPLLMKENLELLSILQPDEMIGVITNLAVPNIESLPVYKKLLTMKASWLVSLESIGNKLEYTRRNAKWSVLKDNYETLYRNPLKLTSMGCHMTYNVLSITTLVETFDWLYEIDPRPGNNWHLISILLGPSQFCVIDFPKEIKLLAIDELDKLEKKYNHYLSASQKNFITSTRSRLYETLNTYNVESVDNFKKYVIQSDKEMSPIKFSDEWPEIAKILSIS